MSRLLYTRVLNLTVTSEVLEWWWRIDRRLSSLLDGSNSATWSNLLSSISDPILGCIRTCLPCRIRSEYLFNLLHSLKILFWPELTPWHSCYAWERALVRLRVVFVFSNRDVSTMTCRGCSLSTSFARLTRSSRPESVGSTALPLPFSCQQWFTSCLISDQWSVISNHLSKC